MNVLDRLIGIAAPEAALRRARARAALRVVEAHYAAGTKTQRASSWRASGADADGASQRRDRLRFIARDMVRNTPLALRGQMVIANNVIGDGIIPKVKAPQVTIERQLRALALAHLDTTAIDADGRSNLYGLQRLVVNAVVDAGEVLVRRRRRRRTDGLPLPFQVQVIEADFIDTSREGTLANGGYIREGIEFDAIGRRAAYWLFDEHPGSTFRPLRGLMSRRVPASEVLHVYRQDRPGQMRGVTWFAPVAMNLQDLADGQDAHLMRQKIAACFAGFVTDTDSVGMPQTAADAEKRDPLGSIVPGRLQRLSPGESIEFPTPPGVDGFDQFTAVILRSVAAGLGITYEALVGDLSQVNFSSARMGRMEMNRNVSSWQWLMVVPQLLQPLAEWFLEAAELQMGRLLPAGTSIDWTPPAVIMVDPTREVAAMRDAVRAGFASRRMQVRALGYDPEEIEAEIAEERAAALEAGLVFDTDAVVPKSGGVPGRVPDVDENDENDQSGGPNDGR
ncbi:MAG: phage portal protein [Rhodobacteraceae bacterium]|jgi:lambda family phage portal protein|nr:phage portal protein [Paracoccaceae bacterium]